MLGGGLTCLLFINTTLAIGSSKITDLQQQNASLTQQEQALQQRVSYEQSPARIAQRARALGMRPQSVINTISGATGRIKTQPAQVDGAQAEPGFTP
ncbi:MAG TPA: septum formation initiator family protein [Streptosporangiaceae bacterium]|jgi:uncharacterized protein HemX